MGTYIEVLVNDTVEPRVTDDSETFEVDKEGLGYEAEDETAVQTVDPKAIM
uniref:Uncharacterized protein n=1 Tax=Solanum tuberosum TaxID=4113 RepID=M1DG83_SOLTU